ncbi:MAG: outer membrane protein assembly factor BamD [Nitrospira sp.]|nr:outer membrane protein assembly factor BamD [Nitrospira sp.]MCP9463840.1 outer membrane protein assembly factor BamD [Nitrospira sp.]
MQRSSCSSPTQSRTPALAFARRARTGFLLAGAALLISCSGGTKDIRDLIKHPISGTDEQIFIEDSTERYYHPNVIMKRGESFFEKEEYAEALTEFNRFLEFYKSHPLAPYAAFRIGEVHMKMAKTIDRDPEPMQKAILAFERVRKEFPGSRYDALALEKLEECHNWLAEMHLFVGRFYYRRGSYLAAAHRFEQILKLYPDRPVAPDALYFLAMSYHEMGADDWARERLNLLVENYPHSSAADQGKSLLAKLKDTSSPSSSAQTSSGSTGSSEHAASSSPSMSNLLSTSRLPSLSIAPPVSVGQTVTACRLGAWC